MEQARYIKREFRDSGIHGPEPIGQGPGGPVRSAVCRDVSLELFQLMSSMTHGDPITDNITLEDFFHQTRYGY